MEPKHTPGPWFINGPFDHESDLFIRATVDDENHDIANLACDETGKVQANARLIAAAPQLLEACRAMLPWLQHGMAVKAFSNCDLSGNAREAHKQAIQAITAAKGET